MGDLFGKDNDPPPPPDYVGAAMAQGAANREAAIAASLLNNPNVISPFGTQTWTGGESGDRPTVIQTFSPEQQALYLKQLQAKGLLADLGVQGTTALQNILGRNLELAGVPAMPSDSAALRDRVYNAMMTRIGQDIARARDQAHSDLIAAGIRPGTAAYEAAMDRINRQETDARQQALLAAGAEAQRDFMMDAQRRRDAIAELLLQRQTPLNEIAALLSGSQVINPFAIPGVAQNVQIMPPPIFGATQAAGQYAADVYNAGQQRQAGLMSGLFGLGSAVLGSPWGGKIFGL